MINAIYGNAIASFQNAGQKLTQVAIDANSDNPDTDVTNSIIQAKMAVHTAEASAVIMKRADEMEKNLLDIIA